MRSKSKLINTERDRVLAEAINRARNAMILLQGTRVSFGRKAVFLNFEKEIFKLTSALQALGLDVSIPVSYTSELAQQVADLASGNATRRQFIT